MQRQQGRPYAGDCRPASLTALEATVGLESWELPHWQNQVDIINFSQQNHAGRPSSWFLRSNKSKLNTLFLKSEFNYLDSKFSANIIVLRPSQFLRGQKSWVICIKDVTCPDFLQLPNSWLKHPEFQSFHFWRRFWSFLGITGWDLSNPLTLWTMWKLIKLLKETHIPKTFWSLLRYAL